MLEFCSLREIYRKMDWELVHSSMGSQRMVTIKSHQEEATGETSMEKEVVFKSGVTQSQIRAYTDTLAFMRSITHPNMCKYLEPKVTINPPLTTVSVLMEAGFTSLEKYIQNSEYCEWYPEELVLEITGLVEVLAIAQRQGRTHHRLSLDHFICYRPKNIKLINFTPVWESQGPNASLEKPIDQIYLCPGARNQGKSDVYSLGICCLLVIYCGGEAIKGSIQKGEVGLLVDQLQTYPQLQGALRLMLEPDERTRVDFLQLETYLHGGGIPTPPVVTNPSVSQSGLKKKVVFKRTCPRCEFKYEGNKCPQCPEVSQSGFQVSAAPLNPAKQKFVMPKSRDPEADILIGRQELGEKCTCKYCGTRFDQKYFDRDPILNQQFKDFCSDDCVMQHALELGSNNER